MKALKTVIAILITVSLSACTNASIIEPRISQAIDGSSRSQDSVDWLIANEEIVMPELLNRISDINNTKAEEALKVISAMGKYGETNVMSRFSSLSQLGKSRVVSLIAGSNDKDSVMKLLALSTLDEGFDVSVSAIVGIGDEAKELLLSLLNTSYYTEAVNTALSSFGDNIIDEMIDVVHSDNDNIKTRALSILAGVGENSIYPLIVDILSFDISLKECKYISQSMLSLYPDAAISAVVDIISSSDVDDKKAATILYNLQDKTMDILRASASAKNAESTIPMLNEYVRLSGVQPVLDIAISTDDETILAGVSMALSSGDYSGETFTAILNTLKPSDGQDSVLHNLSSSLIYDDGLRFLSGSIITQNVEEMNVVYSSGIDIKELGELISKSTSNQEVVQRLDTLLTLMDVESAKRALLIYANGQDNNLPKLVWDKYMSADEQLAKYAGEAIVQSASYGNKLNYITFNFTPYAQKIVDNLGSSDENVVSTASQVLERIPEGVSHNEFYEYIFNVRPNQRIFQIICEHYSGTDKLEVSLSVTSGDTTITPTTISYTIDEYVSNVDKDKYPNFESIIKETLPYLGLSASDDSEIMMAIEIDCRPLSKYYKGMRAASYLGAKSDCEIVLKNSQNDLKTGNGTFIIEAPADNPVDDEVVNYHMENTEDAPILNAFKISYIDALFRTWGVEALYGLYQYNRAACIKVASVLWDN